MVTIKICPKCKSTSVDSFVQVSALKIHITSRQALIEPKYSCRNCGYIGNSFPEIEIKNKLK